MVPDECTTMKSSSWTSARVLEKGIGRTGFPLRVDRKEGTEGTANTVIGWVERME